jgi:hypothetical protein
MDRTRLRRILLPLVLAAALAVAGCAGPDDGTNETGPDGAGEETDGVGEETTTTEEGMGEETTTTE